MLRLGGQNDHDNNIRAADAEHSPKDLQRWITMFDEDEKKVWGAKLSPWEVLGLGDLCVRFAARSLLTFVQA